MKDAGTRKWPEDFEAGEDSGTWLLANSFRDSQGREYFSVEVSGSGDYAQMRLYGDKALELALYLLRNLDPKEA